MPLPPLQHIIQIKIRLELGRDAVPDPVLALFAPAFLVPKKLTVDVLHGIAVPVAAPFDLPHRVGASHADVDNEVNPGLCFGQIVKVP